MFKQSTIVISKQLVAYKTKQYVWSSVVLNQNICLYVSLNFEFSFLDFGFFLDE